MSECVVMENTQISIVQAGTKVVNSECGMDATILRACSWNRNQTRPLSYTVITSEGCREIWDACDTVAID